MEIILLNCNGCGAALDVGPDTRFATCAQCGARLAVKRSETAAYTEVLENLERKTDAIADQIAELQRQNELERIDREWEKERERYLLHHKNGTKSEPSASLGIIAGVLVAVFAVMWLGFAMSLGAPDGFTCFGVMFLIGAVFIAATSVVKARSYQEAHQRYLKRRNAALDRADTSNTKA